MYLLRHNSRSSNDLRRPPKERKISSKITSAQTDLTHYFQQVAAPKSRRQLMHPENIEESTLLFAKKNQRRISFRSFSFTLLLSLLLCACSDPFTSRVAPLPPDTPLRDEHLFIESLNPELLEADPVLLKHSSRAARALTLATAWLSKSRHQLTQGSTGALTSMLRSIQLSLSAIEQGNCENFSSGECQSLNAIQREALLLLFSTLEDRSWIAPRLAPSRYRLSQTSVAVIRQLQKWDVALPPTPTTLIMDRDGIGLPFAGCRQLRKAKICSPLTAILSFREGLSSDIITADISIIDSYQQEIIETNEKRVPVAASFSGAIKSVAKPLATPGQLACLSTPTSSTGVLLIPLSLSRPSTELETFLLSLVTNPSIRNAFTPCITAVQVSDSVPKAGRIARRTIANLSAITKTQLSTSTINLALINLAHETIPFSSLLATTLTSPQTKTWKLLAVGTPPYLFSVQNAQRALEDVAASVSASVFTTGAHCDKDCETALLSNDRLLKDGARFSRHNQKDQTLEDESYSVSSAM
jgi:hypothetical protein